MLDETTAEIVKVLVEPSVGTVDLSVKIKKAIQLNTTYRVDCVVTKISQFRVHAKAIITDPTDGTVYATGEACLANLLAILKAAPLALPTKQN